jgi:cell fate (sporulation/competence/biofilm development) regulator YmcA (YheA/YmcA/DUF963 family)
MPLTRLESRAIAHLFTLAQRLDKVKSYRGAVTRAQAAAAVSACHAAIKDIALSKNATNLKNAKDKLDTALQEVKLKASTADVSLSAIRMLNGAVGGWDADHEKDPPVDPKAPPVDPKAPKGKP